MLRNPNMAQFRYVEGHYFVEDVPVRQIAAAIRTPFYCYSSAAIETAYDAWASAFAGHSVQICYALKANSNQSVIRLLADKGAGADVVSEGEMRRALAAGIPASKIVYGGVAKTTPEIEFALQARIRQFNVESEEELLQISRAAVRLQTEASVAFRINPDIDAGTHEKISTGKSENKFGIPWRTARAAYARAAELPGIEVCGIDIHIGSQLMSLEPYKAAFKRVADLATDLRADGHNISTLDLGGGLGIAYDRIGEQAPTADEYARLAIDVLSHLDCELIIEPGRSLVGAAGILVASVIFVKKGSDRNFLIIDAAMNDLIRPSMYDAFHNIASENTASRGEKEYDVVGPVCETGDTFAKARRLPVLASGDIVVIECAGAYGSVMASTYNTRQLVPEVMVDKNTYRTIRERPGYDDMIGLDIEGDATSVA